ncbi:unnamed protein product [Didymodactylos carnosus]|uniref:SUI1 domain-containing protein n=1 Tax=Didymodactylos carnosus TaxID=1234261 RepID=A0A813NP39_9BILA|nr:unnamed protein product [Didymodactylos carnosus]CAF0752334.1 unnamed protein product [Didymodactylos carnosus]CAF3518649.1 unnamed protein product [Didymodactylos carnosus]CAF3531198.1 unnamed protein product [Didymodactylos carnosus]
MIISDRGPAVIMYRYCIVIMFRKDFKSKSHTQVKSSERKKLRTTLQHVYPSLDENALNSIIPSKEDFTSIKLMLSNGDDIYVYSKNKIPLFFIDKDEYLYPTVYLLWEYPNMIQLKFHTHKEVFLKLLNGAELMLPGLILPPTITPFTFRHVKKGQLCSICLDDNVYPIGIGQMTMDGDDMYMSGMKGKGIVILHIYQDYLWQTGTKTEPPYEKQIEQLFISEDTQRHQSKQTTTEENSVDDQVQQEENDNLISQACATINIDDKEQLENDTVTLEKTNVIDLESNNQIPESMDEILDTIFCYICQRKSKTFELPILVSTFFTIMQDCVNGLDLDLKSSSYKKFSKFLEYQQEINDIIHLEETKKGVLSITSFNISNNEHLERFRTPIWLKSYIKQSNEIEKQKQPISTYTFPVVNELWRSNSHVNDLLNTKQIRTYRADEVRQLIRQYVLEHDLVVDKQVKCDSTICKLFKKLKAENDLVSWNELNGTALNTMAQCYELIFPYREQPIRMNGQIPSIEIQVIDHNKKKQTIIKNLDVYDFDLNEFCKRIRQGANVSAVVDDSIEAKRKYNGRLILAQGNQKLFIVKQLKENYKVPNKFISET